MRLVRYTYPNYRSFVPVLGALARSPWSGLENEIDRLFESGLPAPVSRFPVDLFEDQANAYVRAELPGVREHFVESLFPRLLAQLGVERNVPAKERLDAGAEVAHNGTGTHHDAAHHAERFHHAVAL